MEAVKSVRLVVTGHDQRGNSAFVRDETVSTATIGPVSGLARLWSADAPATYPDGGDDPRAAGFFPPVGGVRVYCSVEGPNQTEFLTAEAYEDGAQGVTSEDGWHTSDSTDFIFVLGGEFTLEMDGGESKTLRAGDLVVDNGTRHRWKVTGDEPGVTLAFIVGANRA